MQFVCLSMTAPQGIDKYRASTGRQVVDMWYLPNQEYQSRAVRQKREIEEEKERGAEEEERRIYENPTGRPT